MEFFKKNKKLVIILLVLIFVVVLGIIIYRKYKNSDAAAETSTAGSSTKTTTETDPLKQKIAQKMAEIRNYPEWYNNIKKDYQSQGYTENQAVASAAIWGLKHDGIIPIDTYGAGEWGHVAYVKANY